MFPSSAIRGAALLSIALALPTATLAQPPAFDASTFDGLRARPIGPATMGGRIAALAGVAGDRITLYVGAAGGGVWKSADGGISFKPIFDRYAQSIGAIAVDPVRPKTVWVGTGESWTRNSVSIGDGVYKSTDGGDNWQRVGLDSSERIARIAVDPQHPDTVFVAATGHLWGAGTQRGVYRTRDGGKSWERVLYQDDQTGCADLAVDPEDPLTVYASMWTFRRRPWSFSSGGEKSGLWKSADGGATWRELRNGLPGGVLGRIAIAIAPSKSSRVYAVVEAKESALYRSDDHGETWIRMNSGANITIRPFYFGHIVVDPKNADRVYKPGQSLSVSEDGGRTFSGAAGGVHSDLHALWINPANPEQMFVGSDGGVYESRDRATRWRLIHDLPVSQFYHVSVDLADPYNVYGGLQDNGTWTAPSRDPNGIRQWQWRNLYGGDGMWAFPDPADRDLVYLEYQGGQMVRVRQSTGETREIKPFHRAGEPEYRWNWNTPMLPSPSQPGVIYCGAQFLFRSRDRGDHWERLSPDLTTNDPEKLKQADSGGLSVDNSAAENHCTLYAIAESPKSPGVIWVGTDDGNLQLTRDGGKTWTNVAKNVPGAPSGACVSSIEAGRFVAGEAFITIDAHALGDMRTLVYRTADFGQSWQPLGSGDIQGYAHVVKQDLVRPDLLFVGTELGLFISVDGGGRWAPFKGNLPPVAVRDLVVHPREGDLVIATHGRGIYILDDLSPLRALTPQVLESEVAFLPSRPSVMQIPADEQRYDGSGEFIGETPEESAFITYWLKKRHVFGDLKLEVYGADGKPISTLLGSKRRGLNRVSWPMRLRPPRVPPAANFVPQRFSFLGPRVPAGTYAVKMIKDKDVYTSQVTLVPDPRSNHSAADRALQQQTVHALYHRLEDLAFLADAVTSTRDQARTRTDSVGGEEPAKTQLAALADRLEELRKTLSATREGRITGEERLREKLGQLYGAVNGYDGRPSGSQLEYAAVLDGELKQAEAAFAEIVAKALPVVNAALALKGATPIAPLTREAWEAGQK